MPKAPTNVSTTKKRVRPCLKSEVVRKYPSGPVITHDDTRSMERPKMAGSGHDEPVAEAFEEQRGCLVGTTSKPWVPC
jgi:hypothetical protein